MRRLDGLRGWTGLFLFAVVALGSAALATRLAADAGERNDLTVTTSLSGSTATFEVMVRAGVEVREVVVRRDGAVVGRLLRSPYVYMAVDLRPGSHRFELEASFDRGAERQVVVVEIPG